MPTHSAHVVGRGIVGLALAFELSQRNWAVTVVGPRAVAGTASRAAVGVSNLKGHITGASPLFATKIRGHQGLMAWLTRVEAASGRVIPRQFGQVYEPFASLTEFDGIRTRVFHRMFTGCFGVKVLDAKALQAHFAECPQVSLPRLYRGAFRYPNDGWFDPVACLEALEEALRRRGTRFIEEPVTRIQPHSDRGLTISTISGQILFAEEVLLAAGVFSDAILAASGLPCLRQEVVAGETVFGAWGGPVDIVVKSGKTNVVANGRRLIVGSTSRRLLAPFDGVLGPDPSGVRDLTLLGRQLLGFSGEPTVCWGLRGRFRDRCPAIGPLFWHGAERRLWVALGFYKNGLQLSHLFAQEIANSLASATPFSPSSAFAAARLFP